MPWSNWTYEQKLKYLLWALPVILLFIYKFSISSTIEQAGQYYELKAELEEFQNNPTAAEKLQKQMKTYHAKLGKFIVEDYYTQDALLDIVGQYCRKTKVKLVDFPKAKYSRTSEYEIEHNQFEVQGDFKSILKLNEQLEKDKSIGRIVGVQWNASKDRVTQKRQLRARIHIKNLKR